MPTNLDRAEWAAAALRHFQCTTGTDYDDALTDLLCDLRHWCNREKVSFDSALNRAQEHYDAETSYMATFHTPVGIATEIFHAASPEDALERAKKFLEDDELSEDQRDPVTEGFCVREIIISSCDEGDLASWMTFEYRVEQAAPKLLAAAEAVIGSWEKGDLAAAVRVLAAVVEKAKGGSA
jgi:predicted RNase H-like HicB family nuclease